MGIYLAIWLGKYSPLSPTLRWTIHYGYSIYHTSWITRGPKTNFICDNIETKAILFFFGCLKVNSAWLITSELANQPIRARQKYYSPMWYILRFDILRSSWSMKYHHKLHCSCWQNLLACILEKRKVWKWNRRHSSAISNFLQSGCVIYIVLMETFLDFGFSLTVVLNVLWNAIYLRSKNSH